MLATFNLMPDGEPGGEVLVPALAERGIDARWVQWDDEGVDWSGADLVAVRATWDYHRRLQDFLAWAQRVEAGSRLLNGAAAFAWNADKAYLLELAGTVATVPTVLLDDRSLVAGLSDALTRWGSVVVKPRTGAGGNGVVVVESLRDERLEGLAAGPWVAQPLVTSVRTRGELSVYVFDGQAVSQVDKRPGGDEIRVHEFHGGRSVPGSLSDETRTIAQHAVAAAAEILGSHPSYARVDLLEHDGRLAVSELELIEPGLYLDVLPGNADLFADLVARVAGLARS